MNLAGGVSIHAPMKGATVTCPNQFRSRPCFNPRTHEGCDFGNRLVPGRSVVSIHAPMKGATRDRSQKDDIRRVSIHAPLARCDHVWHCSLSRTRCFNPRTSCEVRPAPILGFRQLTRFNPRTSCEVRPGLRLEYSKLGLVSIHAPLARCDMDFQQFLTASKAFQSTHLLRGATLDISTLG